ncbi:hypothetical protein HMPREF1544_10884 [Mucor circinelloides 1006PhL]|uniref:Homeobox domain-containing protein n=1 Tax=Mucor circinelloides f. circinelloides (strain 1006PhL) TaxID=1220926 RepID=S2JIR3_MUCC1|nr:hypothetical protein HMPREF1544_10884 [Mucor circinelloides 1006PhL]KAG1089924.1 hypothetical protein G6F42_019840 [Rhizopus arrhizus]
MLSVRSLLIDPQSQAQSQAQIHQPQQKQARSSVLDIASLLNDQGDSYVHIMLSKQQQQQKQQNHSYYTHHYHNHHQGNYTRRSPSTSSHPYCSIDKQQRRSSRQHQIESKKIEQELLNERRQSSSSNSSSSVYSFTTTKSNIQNAGFEDQDIDYDLPLKAKRRRASSKQLDVLNKVFERTFFPSTQLRAELGRQLGMSPRTVQIWFQNKRQAIRTRERSSSSRENSTSPE